MSRYSSTRKVKLKDGREVYSTPRFRKIPKLDSDIYIVTQSSDRLDNLAYQFFGNPALWYIIANANNIHDPSFIVEDGTILRIPKNYTNYINS